MWFDFPSLHYCFVYSRLERWRAQARMWTESKQCREGKSNYLSPDDPMKVQCLLLFACSSVYSPITAEFYFDRISEMFPGRHACFDWMYEKFPMHNAPNNFHSVVFACASVCNIFYLAICRYRPSVISHVWLHLLDCWGRSATHE